MFRIVFEIVSGSVSCGSGMCINFQYVKCVEYLLSNLLEENVCVWNTEHTYVINRDFIAKDLQHYVFLTYCNLSTFQELLCAQHSLRAELFHLEFWSSILTRLSELMGWGFMFGCLLRWSSWQGNSSMFLSIFRCTSSSTAIRCPPKYCNHHSFLAAS